MRLVENFLEKGRNITDDFITSLALANNLLANKPLFYTNRKGSRGNSIKHFPEKVHYFTACKKETISNWEMSR